MRPLERGVRPARSQLAVEKPRSAPWRVPSFRTLDEGFDEDAAVKRNNQVIVGGDGKKARESNKRTDASTTDAEMRGD